MLKSLKYYEEDYYNYTFRWRKSVPNKNIYFNDVDGSVDT